jgi:hypothetical protein
MRMDGERGLGREETPGHESRQRQSHIALPLDPGRHHRVTRTARLARDPADFGIWPVGEVTRCQVRSRQPTLREPRDSPGTRSGLCRCSRLGVSTLASRVAAGGIPRHWTWRSSAIITLVRWNRGSRCPERRYLIFRSQVPLRRSSWSLGHCADRTCLCR